MFISVIPNISFAGVKMDSRETIYYPDSSQKVMNQSMNIPSGSDSTWYGTILRAAKGTAADQGFAYSKDKINLLENNYSWTYTIKTGLFEKHLSSADYGSTFNLFYTPPNRVIYSPKEDNDYASLGIYGDAKNSDTNHLPNAVAVEFDNWNNSLVWDSGTNPTIGTHTAITFPIIVPVNSTLEHFAYRDLPAPYSKRG